MAASKSSILPTSSITSLLLPHAPAAARAPLAPALEGSTKIESLYQLSLHQHPLYESIVGGHVSKAPMFYPGYNGPKRLSLDAVGANGRVAPGLGFLFTGKVLGPIDPTQPAIYSFLVNRGGASPPGPVNNRSMIFYDAVVRVATGPGGTTGTVALLSPKGQTLSTTALPASDVQISGTNVNVNLPADLLPSTSPPNTRLWISRYFYTFAAGVPAGAGANPAVDYASFAPEYSIAPVDSSSFRRR